MSHHGEWAYGVEHGTCDVSPNPHVKTPRCKNWKKYVNPANMQSGDKKEKPRER